MTANPFVVHIARLERVTGTTWHEVRRGLFDPLGDLGAPSPGSAAVVAGAQAECDVVLQSYAGGVMATGTVRAPWEGLCRRCAQPVTGELEIRVAERFVVPAATDPSAGGHGGEGGAIHGTSGAGPIGGLDDDDDAYPIVDHEIDLGPMVRDAVILDLPLAPLCRPECQGLCAGCGADLNEEPCGCEPSVDPRWANLKLLR